jgi:hypothetical protein
MKKICETLQAKLAADGAAALRGDSAAEAHLVDCNECYALLEQVAALDTELRNLPELDVSDSVVGDLLDRIANEDSSSPRHSRWLGMRRLRPAWRFAAAAVLALAVAAAGLLMRDRFGGTAVPPATDSPDLVADAGTVPDTPPTAVAPEPEPEPVTTPIEEPQDDPVVRKWPDLPAPPADESTSEETSIAIADPTPVAPSAESFEFIAEAPAPQAEPEPEPYSHYDFTNTPAVESTKTGAMAVTVLDDDNGPLPGATVTISNEDRTIRTLSLLSNKDGEATIPSLPPSGSYNVEVSFPGFGTQRRQGVTVQPGQGQDVVIVLAEEYTERITVAAQRGFVDLEKTGTSTRFTDEFISELPVPGRFYQNVLTLAPGVQEASDDDKNVEVHKSRSRDFKSTVGGVSNVDPLTGEFATSVDPNSTEEMEVVTRGAGPQFGRARGGFANIDLGQARAFLAERGQFENLTHKDARGYWANTYVPGDSTLRTLQARLAGADRSELGFGAALRGLHQASKRLPQPFDPPRGSAMAVYLHADQTALSEPGRVLLQVGLQATSRHGGSRPAMNLAVVLDLPDDLSPEEAASLRALLEALNHSRRSGDRMRVLVAGKPGGLVARPEQFRHGYLQVMLDRLLTGDEPFDGPSLDVVQATRRAMSRVAHGGDDTAPLGSNAVILVSRGSFGERLEPLVDLAHRGALGGTPLSVVALGRNASLDAIDRVILAGQGNRRLLLKPADAEGLVDRELAAAGRAVARALRLRIRLAPGVKLINVLGTEWLDEQQAQKVRAAERSIDRRTARNVGIRADRGEDEDGIQIVIPSFYAGDRHVVLLDLVAPGPGPLAEARLRYKDLVHVRNGTARDSLKIRRGESARGPLELNVLKNLLALRVSETLERAGQALSSGRPAEAAGLLETTRRLLDGLPALVPGLEGDPDLLADAAMLGDYVATLEAEGGPSPASIAYLSDSLRYAARLKVLPKPEAR